MKSNRLYVGNLTYSVTNEQLKELFSKYGEVMHVKIKEGKGFGFVEMYDSQGAEKAREALNGTEFEGRTLNVDEARPPKFWGGHGRDFKGGQRGGYRG